ncbi:MAG: AMP-binding protein, partial [Acidobacteria bacterium]|nr:AMP-binding protein [Acidobacteriota bacterium]
MSETIQGYRLSLQQERLWTLALATPEPFRARLEILLEGDLDEAALRRALQRVTERHEILRTRFSLLPGMTFPLQVVEAAETSQAMAACLEGSGRAHRLRVELPALCADHQALVNLAREIALAYEACRHPRDAQEPREPREPGETGEPGEPGKPGAEPLQYADFAGWQREAAEAHDAAARKLWQDSLPAEALRARLPGSSSAAAAEPFAPGTLRFALPRAAVERLAAAAGGPPAAATAVVLAAWVLLLQRHLGTPRAMVGVGVSGRRFAELQEALGLYSRYVPCAFGVPETAPLAAAAGDLAARLAELAGRQDSFSWEGLDLPAGTPRFFPFGFEWRELPPAWQVDGVRFSIGETSALVDRFVAKLAVVRRAADPQASAAAVPAAPAAAPEEEEDDAGELLYDAAALPPEQAELLAGRLTALLRDAGERTAAAAGDLELLGESERRQILVDLNRTDADLGGTVERRPGDPAPGTLAALFETRARLTPHLVALAAAGETLTYGELEARANRLARRLRRSGVGPEVPVALSVERSFGLVTALLAIAKAGGAYVPVDPGYPRERRDFMLADCGAALLLAGEDLEA